MKKTILIFISTIMIMLLFSIEIFGDDTVDAKITNSQITLNNGIVSIQGFNINNNNYFKLRDLAQIFNNTESKFNVKWNKETKIVDIITQQDYVDNTNNNKINYFTNVSYTAKLTNSKIMLNGKKINIQVYKINGSNYFKLRDLGNLIPFRVDWCQESKTVLLYSKNYVEPKVNNIFNKLNDNKLGFIFYRWANTTKQYIYSDDNENINVVDIIRKNDNKNPNTNNIKSLVVSFYDKNRVLKNNKIIDIDLNIFGAFYAGENYNYVISGQENKDEMADKEVIRVVKYDKAFNEIKSISIYGKDCFTTVPFKAGCGRVEEKGSQLILHTSRERYKSKDGNNHQSQLTIIIDTNTMKVTNSLKLFQPNHVSHSFDQYVKFDNDKHVLVDHGDAYPRSVVLSKSNGKNYKKVNLFDIPGKIGANCTGVNVGGFEISSSNYLVAINSIDHSKVKEYNSYKMVGLDRDQRDIFILSTPKEKLDKSSVKKIKIAKYVDTNKLSSVPKFIKITDNKFLIMWKEYTIEKGETEIIKENNVKYVYIDNKGNQIGEIKEIKNCNLSTTQPIVINNRVVWAVNYRGKQKIYFLNIE